MYKNIKEDKKSARQGGKKCVYECHIGDEKGRRRKEKQDKKLYVTDGNIMYLTDASRFLISCVIQHYAPVVGWGGWRNRCIMLIMTLDSS
jgi:hypothetical protein